MKKYLPSIIELTALILWLYCDSKDAYIYWGLSLILQLLMGICVERIKFSLAAGGKTYTVSIEQEGPMPNWFFYPRLVITAGLLALHGQYWFVLASIIAHYPRARAEKVASPEA